MSISRASLESFTTCGELLKFLRRRARLSQRELSIAVGYSESHISRIETDERPLDRASLLALFVPALGIDKEPEFIEQLLRLCSQTNPTDVQAGAAAPSSSLVAPSQRHSYLPVQLTSFVGRAEEITEVCALLADKKTRLLTLSGAGGCGKTRLALRAAEESAHCYEHGVWLVELAPLAQDRLLPQAVADTLRLTEQPGRSALSLLSEFLTSRQTLLILDNCEHLVEAAAILAATLLLACPRLQILATSREALGVPGEVNYHVQPLALPPARRGARPTTVNVAAYEAIQLFVERARAALHTFTLTDENAPDVTRICQRLDGIPLGIELAATWVALLSPAQIADRLERDLELLASAGRTVLPRHQTLVGAMEWSYDLLTGPERSLLRRLAVFAGGWSLESAEAIAMDATDVGDIAQLNASQQTLRLLNRLASKSLVVVEMQTDDARYRLLEPLRQYLATKLRECGDEDAARSCHLRYFLDLAGRWERQTRGAAQLSALAALDREQDNFRAALAWGLLSSAASSEDQRLAGLLAYRLGRYWVVRQSWREGREWLAKALALTGRSATSSHPSQTTADDRSLQAKLLYRAGQLAVGQGDLPAGAQLLEQSVALQRQEGNMRGVVRCLHELGGLAIEHGDYDRAALWLNESLGHSRDLGDEWLLAVSLTKLADLAGEQGDYARTAELAGESLVIVRRLNDTGLIVTDLILLAQSVMYLGQPAEAVVLLEEVLMRDRQRNPQSKGGAWIFRNLGLAWQLQGETARAAEYYGKSLLLRQEQGQAGGMAWALEGLGETAALNQQPRRAAQLWGAAERLRRSVGSTMSQNDRLRHEAMVAAARAALGAAAFAAAWQVGATMSVEECVAFALGQDAIQGGDSQATAARNAA